MHSYVTDGYSPSPPEGRIWSSLLIPRVIQMERQFELSFPEKPRGVKGIVLPSQVVKLVSCPFSARHKIENQSE